MQSFTKIQQNFIALKTAYQKSQSEFQAKIDAVKERANKLQKKVERLEKAKENIDYPYWTDLLLVPLLNEIAKQTPNLKWDFENSKTLNCFGMRAECPVFASDKDGNTIVTLVFTPGDLSIGELFYDTREKIRELREGEMDYNGFNNVTKEVQGVEQLLEFVNAQIKETEGCFFYLNMKLKPIRKFTKAESKKGIGLPLKSIGVSNYKNSRDSETNYSHKDFYEAAVKKGLDYADVFLLNDSFEVVPCENELFKLVKK